MARVVSVTRSAPPKRTPSGVGVQMGGAERLCEACLCLAALGVAGTGGLVPTVEAESGRGTPAQDSRAGGGGQAGVAGRAVSAAAVQRRECDETAEAEPSGLSS